MFWLDCGPPSRRYPPVSLTSDPFVSLHLEVTLALALRQPFALRSHHMLSVDLLCGLSHTNHTRLQLRQDGRLATGFGRPLGVRDCIQ